LTHTHIVSHDLQKNRAPSVWVCNPSPDTAPHCRTASRPRRRRRSVHWGDPRNGGETYLRGAKSWEIYRGMLWFYMVLDDLYMVLYGLFIWFLYGLSWEIDRKTSKWSGKNRGKLAKIIQNHPSSWWWSMDKKTTWGSHISGNLHTYAQETVKKRSTNHPIGCVFAVSTEPSCFPHLLCWLQRRSKWPCLIGKSMIKID
jgi:hypothetical protein